jgi:hypothetical protein
MSENKKSSNKKNKNNAFSGITDVYKDLGIDLSKNNPNNIFDHQNPTTPENIFFKPYNTLNNYDPDTLDRMSDNTVNFNEQSGPEYITNKIPHYSQFIQHRDPSLNFGLNPFPVQNMTVLPNQIHRSLDLLKQTDKMAISNFNANSDFNTLDRHFSQGITNPNGKLNQSNTENAFIKQKQVTFSSDSNLTQSNSTQFNSTQFNSTQLNSTIDYNPHEYNPNPYIHNNPEIEKNYGIVASNDNSNNEQNYKQRKIPTFDKFVSPRDPALEVGMISMPIQNMTVLPNQIHRSLDLLHQPDQMNVSNFNKYSNYVNDSKIINDNDVEIRADNFQGISQPFIPYPEHETPNALLNNFANDGRMDLVREYICHVNSINRDVKRYPNPFNFLVQLNPLSTTTDAAISRAFHNIRYIKIETGTLPRKYYLKKSVLESNHTDITSLFSSTTGPADNSLISISGSIPSTNWAIIYSQFPSTSNSNQKIIIYTNELDDQSDVMNVVYEAIYDITTYTTITYKYELSSYSLDSDKYSILYLNDINDVSQYSTDQNLSQAFNVLYPDTVSESTVYVDCRYVDKIYKFSELGNLTRMLLRLTNSMGKDLTTNVKAQDSNVSTLSDISCSCLTDQYGNYQRNYKCICSYIRHPRYIKNQLDLMFKLGIVETDFDKRPFN